MSDAGISTPDRDQRIAALEALLAERDAALADARADIAARDLLIDMLRVQIARLKRMQFGKSSEKLATLSPAQLRTEWQRLYKTAAPRVSPDLLARGVAWKLQERALGGLSPSTVRELRQLDCKQGEVRGGGAAAPALASAAGLRPGTTLMRTWGDRNWSVLVTEDGLVFEGQHYASLSQIAREITGAHWSGPRFFGLKASPSSTAATASNRAKTSFLSQSHA